MPRLPPLLLVEVLTPHRVKPSYRTRLLLGLDVPASAFTAGSGCGLQSFDRIECLTTQPLVIAKSAQRHKVFGVSKLPWYRPLGGSTSIEDTLRRLWKLSLALRSDGNWLTNSCTNLVVDGQGNAFSDLK